MSKEGYIVCTATVDGWGMSEVISSEEMSKHLEEITKEADECDRTIKFCKSYEEFDPEYVSDGIEKVLVIKGKIVVPEPKEKVTVYEIE